MDATSKDEMLASLAGRVSAVKPSLERDKVLAVLKERESLGSTGIGGGVAIPHGKLLDLDKLLIVIARSIGGVNFDSADNLPVHLLFLVLAPDSAAPVYLKMLARISRLVKMEEVYNRLMEAADEAAIEKVIREVDVTL